MTLDGYTFRGSYWIDRDGLMVCDRLADELNRRYLDHSLAQSGESARIGRKGDPRSARRWRMAPARESCP